MNETKQTQNTEMWEQWQKGQDYLASSGLSNTIPMAVRFYQGDQWAKPTERTKALPRPVVNVTKLICRNKQSGILNTPVRLIFKTSESEKGVKYSHFVDWMQKECDQESLDKKAIKDGVQKGCYVFHYFWDKDAKGKDGKQHGALRCEVIDPLNIIFANPCECDEQKQKYIIIATREDVDSVKAMAEDGVDKDAIVPDDKLKNNYGEETPSNNLVTVLTKYYRVNGEVYWSKATQNVVLNKGQSLAPNLEKAKEQLGIKEEDAPNTSLPDAEDKEVERDVEATLYPIVVGQYEERENSIYGLSEVEGIIPNQKILNNTLALYVLNIMSISFGKYIVSEDALQGQRITNEPAQILVNHSKINPTSGIKKLEEQPIQSHALGLVDKFLEYTRSMTGSTEVMTGEALGKNQSGAAIAQLQMTAQMPLEDLRARWWLNKRKQGLIYLQFIRTHYDEGIEYSFEEEETTTDDYGIEQTEAITKVDVFNAHEFDNIHFDVTVEASAGAKATIVSDIAFLDALYQSGKISDEQYISLYPDGAISNKESILKAVKENKHSIEFQLQQAMATIEQLQTKIQQDADLVDKASGMVSENQKLKQELITLYAQANSQLIEATANLEDSRADNEFFAATLYDAAQKAQQMDMISPPMGE